MNPGKFKYRISIQELDGTRDELGQPNQVWSDILNTWAAKDQNGSKKTSGERSDIVESSIFVIRNRLAFDPESKMRILWGGHVYEVVSIDRFDNYSHITCERHERDG